MFIPKNSLLVVALYFFIGGLSHFIFADFLVAVVPSYIPFQKLLIYLVGFLEIAGALGILLPSTRLLAAYCLMALCVAIFPANLNMALHSYLFQEVPALWLYFMPLFQMGIIAFIAWAISGERQIRKRKKYIIKSHKTIDERCKALSTAFTGELEWKWDSRYSVVMAEFTVAQEQAIFDALECHFEHTWDALTITQAPEMMVKTLKNMGGMQLNQTLFTSNIIDGGFVFAFVWPWEDKKTLSVRLSSFYDIESEQEAFARMAKLKAWFSIKPKESGWIKINSD